MSMRNILFRLGANRSAAAVRRPALLSLVLLGTTLWTVGEAPSQGADPSEPVAKITNPDKPSSSLQIREGTRIIDRLGRFKATGDRATFYASDGQLRLGTLENLALERILLVIEESSDSLEWNVSGTVTEFRGSNYLIVSRAQVKARPQPRTSAQ